MNTIIKLSIKLFRRHLKRSLMMMLGITITMFFAISIISVFFSYNDMLIENAYTYGGRWDIKIESTDIISREELLENSNITDVGQVQTVWTARLDAITESEKEGPGAAFATHWLMALQGCDTNSFDMLQHQLKTGHWPGKENEIVLSSNFMLNGKSVQNGDIKIGDTVVLELGKRIAEDGNIIHSQQVEGPEQFFETITREYKVSGILSGYDRSSGVFVSSGVVSTSNYDENSIFLLKTKAATQAELDEMTRQLSQTFSLMPEQIVPNEFLTNAFMSIEQSDYFQSIAYGGIFFIVGLVIVCSGTMLNNLLMTVHESKKRIGLLRMVGAGKTHIYLIFVFQSVMTAACSSVIGVLLSYAAADSVSRLIGVLKLSEFSDINIVIQPHVVAITVLITFVINVLLALATARTTYSHAPVKAFQSGLSVSEYKANNSNLIDLVGRLSNSLAVAWRGLARKKFRTTLSVIALIISLSVLTLGLSIGTTLWNESQRALRGFDSDFVVIFSPEQDNTEQLLSAFPPVKNKVVMYTSNRNVEIPNEHLTPEIIDFLKIGNANLLRSMSICSIDESLYNDLDPDGKLMPFSDFERSGGCLITNIAILTSESDTSLQDGNNDFSYVDQSNSNDERIVSITTLSAGNHLKIFPEFGSEDSILLTIQGVLSKTRTRPLENSIDTIVYMPEQVFLEYITQGYNRVMFIDAFPGEQDEIGQFLTENRGELGYFMQDNTLITGSAKDNNTIQTMTIFSIIIIIVLLCTISIFSIVRTDFFQRRRETALARALGESLSSALKIRFLEDMTVLITAVACSILVFLLMFRLIAQSIMDFYQLNSSIIWGYLLLSSSIMLIIIFGHNTYSLIKAFKQKIIDDLASY